MENLLVANNISKSYDGQTNVLSSIDLKVKKGEFLAIMGSSGSGKTTLLNSLSMIDPPTSGQILFNGADLTSMSDNQLADFRSENISYIFQSYNLISSMTVYENIILPLQIRGDKVSNLDSQIDQTLDRLNIAKYKNHFPDQLSGGQRQRVATVRALISQSDILIADEPTGALDSANSDNLMDLFSQLNKTYATTILMVTHDPLATQYAERVIFLKDGVISGELRRGLDESQKNYLDRIYARMSEV